MSSTFVKVRRYSNPIGQSCMHCGRPATTKAIRVNELRLAVAYCDLHAELIIENGATRKEEE